MAVIIKSNIEPHKLTVDSGGAKKINLITNPNLNEVNLNILQYPNITINKIGGNIDGGIIM